MVYAKLQIRFPAKNINPAFGQVQAHLLEKHTTLSLINYKKLKFKSFPSENFMNFRNKHVLYNGDQIPHNLTCMSTDIVFFY